MLKLEDGIEEEKKTRRSFIAHICMMYSETCSLHLTRPLLRSSRQLFVEDNYWTITQYMFLIIKKKLFKR